MVILARILLFLFIIVLMAALGAVLAFIGVLLIGALTGVDDREGALAMGAAGFMPYGAVFGAVAGILLALRTVPRVEARTALALGYGFPGMVLLAVAGWYLHGELTDGNPYAQGSEPVVLIEWRLPESFPHEQVPRVFRHSMRSTSMNWTLDLGWDDPPAREENGRTVLRLRGEIRWRAAGRTLQVWRAPNHDDRITVPLELGRDPAGQDDYGPWREVASAPGNAFRTRIVRP